MSTDFSLLLYCFRVNNTGHLAVQHQQVYMRSRLTNMDLLNWNVIELPGTDVHDAIQEIDWDKLCRFASQLNNGLACVPLDKITNGLHNIVRIIEFSDQTRWIARVSLRTSATASTELQNELNVMQILRDRSSLLVPRVFAYEVDRANPIGYPFMLMEFIQGNTGMDSAGGFESHRGRIPPAYRPTFYRSVAKCHVGLLAPVLLVFPNLFPLTSILFLTHRIRYKSPVYGSPRLGPLLSCQMASTTLVLYPSSADRSAQQETSSTHGQHMPNFPGTGTSFLDSCRENRQTSSGRALLIFRHKYKLWPIACHLNMIATAGRFRSAIAISSTAISLLIKIGRLWLLLTGKVLGQHHWSLLHFQNS